MKCHIKLPPGASQGTTKSSSADSWIQRLVSENGLTKIDINQSSAVVWLHHTSNDIYVVQNPKYVQYISIIIHWLLMQSIGKQYSLLQYKPVIFLRQNQQKYPVLQERHTRTTRLGRRGAWVHPMMSLPQSINHDGWSMNSKCRKWSTIMKPRFMTSYMLHVMVKCAGSTQPFTTSNWVSVESKPTNRSRKQPKQWGGEFNAPFVSSHHLSVSLSSLLGSRSTCATRSANLNASVEPWNDPCLSFWFWTSRQDPRCARRSLCDSSSIEVVEFRGSMMWEIQGCRKNIIQGFGGDLPFSSIFRSCSCMFFQTVCRF